MVRDMRGMRGKSRRFGLMSASVGDQRVWEHPCRRGFCALMAPIDMRLLQGGIHALAGYAVAATVGEGGFPGVAGGAGSSSEIVDKNVHGIPGEDLWQGAACAPGLRRDGGAFLAGKRGSRLRRRLGRVWDGHEYLGADWGYFVSRIWRFFCEVFRPDGLFPRRGTIQPSIARSMIPRHYLLGTALASAGASFLLGQGITLADRCPKRCKIFTR